MRAIERTSKFKREARGQHRATLDASLVAVLLPLASDVRLAERYRYHPLTGEFRAAECRLSAWAAAGTIDSKRTFDLSA